MQVRDRLLLLVLIVVLIGAVFGPTLPKLSTQFLGIEYVDHYGTQWFYWFVEEQARSGESSDHTGLFFHPWGKDIYAHTGTNVLDAWLALPFRMLLGHVLGYNIFVLVMLAVSGVAFYWLARECTDDMLSAGVAALLFSVSPFILFETGEGRPTQSILLFVILFVLFVLRTGRQRGWKAPVLAGIMLALSGYQYWYYAFFGGMVCLAHGLWHTVRPLPESGGGRATLLRHALIAAVALSLTLPGGWSLIAQTAGGSGEIPGLLDTDLWTMTASPPVTREELTIGLQLWQPLRPWAGFFVQDADGTERFLEHAVVMPWMLLPLMALAIWRPNKMSRGGFAAMVATAILLAMGPLLIIGDHFLPNAPFIYLIKSIGFLQRLWWPGRAVALVVVFLGMAIAAVLGGLAHRRRLHLGAIVLLTGLWAGELRRGETLPFPTWDATIPAGFHCLATGPEGAVIELPYAWTQAHLYFQIIHGRPIMGGMLENNETFTPDEFTVLKEENEFLKTLLTLTKMKHIEVTNSEEDLEELYDLGYRYILLQKDAFFQKGGAETPGLIDNAMRTRLRNMKKQLRSTIGEPVYSDARVSIYAPWGDPSPCEGSEPEPDTKLVGLTETPVDARLVRTPEEQVITRFWTAPEGEDEAEDDSEPVEAAPEE